MPKHGRFRCFWCLRLLPLRYRTRDHLIPRCRGGIGLPDNTRAACRACNHSRGHVTCFWGRLQRLRWLIDRWSTLPAWQQASIRSSLHEARLVHGGFVRLKRYWSCLELVRLGWSATREIDLTLPRVPRGR